jgi:cytoskeletal protein CcmA (bactofilin family)
MCSIRGGTPLRRKIGEAGGVLDFVCERYNTRVRRFFSFLGSQEKGGTMLEGKKKEGAFVDGEVNTFLGKGTDFEGKIRFVGLLRVDGKVQGEILSGDFLVTGDTGEVNGQINVNRVLVNGRVSGSLKANNRIEIPPSGQIRGNIETSVLVISEGAIFEGTCKMGKRPPSLYERITGLKKKGDEIAAADVEKR